MENDKIYKYLAEGKERELLDKLMVFSFDKFNPQLQNLLKILLIIIESSRDPHAAHQFFYKTILPVLPEIIVIKDKLSAFIKLLTINSISPYQQASFLVKDFIISVEDKKFEGAKYIDKEITLDQLEDFKLQMTKVNVSFLKHAIKDKVKHDAIMFIFYSCVEKLEAERKIIISKEAIILIRKYLLANPEEYLKGFIRPLYSGGINPSSVEYYLHVPEPFSSQIFDNDFSFEDFLSLAKEKKIDKLLATDLEDFYNRLNGRPVIDGNKSLMLRNPEIPDALDLKSKLHKNVRLEFK